MVQVITPTRQKQPSFLQSVVGGLAESVPGAIGKHYDTKRQQKQDELDFFRKMALEENKQQSKYSARLGALKESGLLGNSDFMDAEQRPEELKFSESFSDTESPSKSFKSSISGDKAPHSQQKIDAAALFEPTLANTYQRQNEDWRRQKQHEENLENNRTKEARKEALDFHKESSKYDEELLNSYKRSVNQDVAINDIVNSVKSGKVKPSHLASMFKGVGTWGDKLATALLNKNEAQIQASIPYLIEGWKEVFGVRLSDADLKIIQDKLPDIGKSPEANMSIARILQKYSDLNKLRYNVAKNIKDKNKGLRPLGYADKVEEQFMNMSKPLKVRNPHTGNVVEIPAFKVSAYLEDGGELVDE